MLRIRFTRTPGGQTLLTCVRADSGATACAADRRLVERAMLHYAVETILGYREGLFGLVARGWDIAGLGAGLPPEARLAEQVVGVVQRLMRGALDVWDASAALAEALAGTGIAAPVLGERQLESIMGQARANLEEWAELHPGATLELPFPLARAARMEAP